LEGAVRDHLVDAELLEDRLEILVVTLREVRGIAYAVDAAGSRAKGQQRIVKIGTERGPS
jgi:hypothetical protein